jgi:hypothetical protein
VISGEDVAIYKHHSVTLSSVQNFWKGKLGFQQFPCVSNVGTTPVFTAAGKINPNWDNRSAENACENLPYVAQKKNVALLMYRPEKNVLILGYNHPDVSLYFKDTDYDEVRNDSLWLLGRQGSNYVAVRRSCVGTIDTVRACHILPGQAWVIMVGDSQLYGSFNHFQLVIDSAKFTEQWYVDSAHQSVYYAHIIVDSVSIEYAWGRDSAQDATGIQDIDASAEILKVFPNPAQSSVTIETVSEHTDGTIEIYNTMGVLMYHAPITAPSINVTTADWADGLYVVKVWNGREVATRNIAVSH